ncbi:saccharopine dehydrogenase family protein [Helicobacter rodentium]|uniref:saccharopine dehydrogenase family protein n=1 Tax=Helicobacter rodentium TaxID=59617 RepID=UPI00047E791A|nr:saccharopine dehydrogenase family protein [Helicobacter rodentium]
MAVVLQIGAGGVGGVVAHKMAQNREVFSRIILASRTLSKCRAIADSIRAKGLGEIEIDAVDADNVESLVALIEKYRPKLVVNVALPYQDLAIMEACLRTKTHYLDTANYEHPDSAHFEYKEQWAYDARYKEAGIYALLGSGFDPGVTNVFCAYAQKHYFDEIESIDILDCNAGDHGYAFATNFNPEINLREVSSKARYWVARSACSDFLGSATDASLRSMSNTPHSLTSHNPKNSSTILERGAQDSGSQVDSKSSLVSQTDTAINSDLQQDTIYRKFEREEKHFALESNTQNLQVVDYAGGQWRDIPPLALMKEWDYPEVGVKNSYLLYHEELESLVRNIKGLKRIRFFMTFGESYLTHMKCLENVGLLRVDSVEHKGQKIVPIEVLKTLLPDPASLASRTKGKTNIGCYMRGIKDGKERTIYIYNVCEHEKCYAEVNAQGVSYTTGVPAMIGAKLICEGKWGVGANSVCSDFLRSASDTSLRSMSNTPHSLTSHNLKNSSTTLEFEDLKESYNAERLEANQDMPKGGEYQGIDNALELQNGNNKNCAEVASSDRNSKIVDEKSELRSCECGDKTQASIAQMSDKLSDLSLQAEFQGSGVWNMEQNDPDPFMQELNKQGLPYVVLEIESNGEAKVLEDGRESEICLSACGI